MIQQVNTNRQQEYNTIIYISNLFTFDNVHFLTVMYGNTTYLSTLILFPGIHLVASPSRKGG